MITTSSLTDHELLNRIAEGSEEEFKILYERYSAQLFPFLARLTGSPVEAREVLQETFFKLWLSRTALHDIEHPRAYIYRVAANTAHNWMKKMFVARKAERQHSSTSDGQNPAAAHDRFDVKDIQRIMEDIIRQMPLQRQKIYQMHRTQQLKASEIASQLNVSVSTVKNTLATALKNLRDGLIKAGYPYILVYIALENLK